MKPCGDLTDCGNIIDGMGEVLLLTFPVAINEFSK